jgi:hypothetical protein
MSPATITSGPCVVAGAAGLVADVVSVVLFVPAAVAAAVVDAGVAGFADAVGFAEAVDAVGAVDAVDAFVEPQAPRIATALAPANSNVRVLFVMMGFLRCAGWR